MANPKFKIGDEVHVRWPGKTAGFLGVVTFVSNEFYPLYTIRATFETESSYLGKRVDLELRVAETFPPLINGG